MQLPGVEEPGPVLLPRMPAASSGSATTKCGYLLTACWDLDCLGCLVKVLEGSSRELGKLWVLFLPGLFLPGP